jgi:AraC-like DNA-binding protein
LTKVLGLHERMPGQFVEPMEFLLPPLLAAYAVAAVRGGFRFRWLLLVHLIPFLAASATAICFASPGLVPPTISIVMWSILTLQMGVYLGPALRMFHRYQASLTDRVSNLAPVDLGWLRGFFCVATGLCVLSLVVLVLLLHALTPAILGTGTAIALTAAVWFLGWRGLEQRFPEPLDPEPSSHVSSARAISSLPAESAAADALAVAPSSDTSVPNPCAGGLTLEKPLLPPDEARRIGAKLDAIFVAQRPHLNPDLGLSDLAQMLDLPRNHLSFAINSELGVNFYDLVNGWRVKEFRSLAADPRRDGDKLLTLAFDAGFNSKPTFNKVVLKLTGKTPTQVRQEEIESRRSP